MLFLFIEINPFAQYNSSKIYSPEDRQILIGFANSGKTYTSTIQIKFVLKNLEFAQTKKIMTQKIFQNSFTIFYIQQTFFPRF